MATIRWCSIFPKWDSYQPLFFDNLQLSARNSMNVPKDSIDRLGAPDMAQSPQTLPWREVLAAVVRSSRCFQHFSQIGILVETYVHYRYKDVNNGVYIVTVLIQQLYNIFNPDRCQLFSVGIHFDQGPQPSCFWHMHKGGPMPIACFLCHPRNPWPVRQITPFRMVYPPSNCHPREGSNNRQNPFTQVCI